MKLLMVLRAFNSCSLIRKKKTSVKSRVQDARFNLDVARPFQAAFCRFARDLAFIITCPTGLIAREEGSLMRQVISKSLTSLCKFSNISMESGNSGRIYIQR